LHTQKKFPLFIKISHLFVRCCEGVPFRTQRYKSIALDGDGKNAIFPPRPNKRKPSSRIRADRLSITIRIPTFATLAAASRPEPGEEPRGESGKINAARSPNPEDCIMKFFMTHEVAQLHCVTRLEARLADRVQAPKTCSHSLRLLVEHENEANGVKIEFFLPPTRKTYDFHRPPREFWWTLCLRFQLCVELSISFGWKLMMCHLKMALGSISGASNETKRRTSATRTCVSATVHVRKRSKETFSTACLPDSCHINDYTVLGKSICPILTH
jgi:hypothetical protein